MIFFTANGHLKWPVLFEQQDTIKALFLDNKQHLDGLLQSYSIYICLSLYKSSTRNLCFYAHMFMKLSSSIYVPQWMIRMYGSVFGVSGIKFQNFPNIYFTESWGFGENCIHLRDLWLQVWTKQILVRSVYF